jgi:hypothetical protein
MQFQVQLMIQLACFLGCLLGALGQVYDDGTRQPGTLLLNMLIKNEAEVLQDSNRPPTFAIRMHGMNAYSSPVTFCVEEDPPLECHDPLPHSMSRRANALVHVTYVLFVSFHEMRRTVSKLSLTFPYQCQGRFTSAFYTCLHSPLPVLSTLFDDLAAHYSPCTNFFHDMVFFSIWKDLYPNGRL